MNYAIIVEHILRTGKRCYTKSTSVYPALSVLKYAFLVVTFGQEQDAGRKNWSLYPNSLTIKNQWNKFIMEVRNDVDKHKEA